MVCHRLRISKKGILGIVWEKSEVILLPFLRNSEKIEAVSFIKIQNPVFEKKKKIVYERGKIKTSNKEGPKPVTRYFFRKIGLKVELNRFKTFRWPPSGYGPDKDRKFINLSRISLESKLKNCVVLRDGGSLLSHSIRTLDSLVPRLKVNRKSKVTIRPEISVIGGRLSEIRGKSGNSFNPEKSKKFVQKVEI